jgi:hypothetical protein
MKCSVDNCSREKLWKGMCGMHYQRFMKHGDPLFIPINSCRRPIIDRLQSNVIRTQSGCILRLGTGTGTGYKLIQINGKARLAHRVAYELANGEIPADQLVLHRCDQPSCINPEHLFLGTQLDNMRDMIAKGRKRSPSGEDAPNTKLTLDQVREIRASTESQRLLAKRYGVSLSAISNVRTGDTWA